MKERLQKLRLYLKTKNKFILQDPKTFEEKFALSISKRNTLFVSLFLILLFSFLVFLVISYTGLKTYIPGFPKNASEVYEQDKTNQERLIEFESQTRNRELWIANLQSILNNEDTLSIDKLNEFINKDSSFDYKSIVFERSKIDSILREKDKTYNTTNKNSIAKSILVSVLKFQLPHEGKISKTKQKGLNVATFSARYKSDVKVAMEGKVISKNKNSIVLQHQNNMVSIYDNLTRIKPEVGEKVSQGKVIGIVPDSAFRFQIWYNGETIPVEVYRNL